MIRNLAPLLAGLAIGLSSPPADAREGSPDPSTRFVLPGCRAVAAGRNTSSNPEAAFCTGTIEALVYLGEMLPEDFRYCVPFSVPLREIVEAVVYELDELGPVGDAQQFRGLAIAILQFKWPCRY
jgi:hypothetical protein